MTKNDTTCQQIHYLPLNETLDSMGNGRLLLGPPDVRVQLKRRENE